MNTNRVVKLHPDADLIREFGGSAALARQLDMVQPQGTRTVNNWKTRGIPPRVRLSRPDVFCPDLARMDVKGGMDAAQHSSVQTIASTVDLHMSKRALRARLGFANDKQLATVLGLPLAQVESWEDDRALPAVPQVLRLLGHQPQAIAEAPPEDPDETRIVPVEVA